MRISDWSPDVCSSDLLSNPKVAGATGDALIGYGHYAQAIPLYQAAASAGGADKETWTYRLAVAQALSGDTAAAKAGFGQITGAYKLLSRFWVAKLDAVPAAPAAAAPADRKSTRLNSSH